MQLENEVLEDAVERIGRIRQGELIVLVTDGDGIPLPGRDLCVSQVRSSFLFGCNVFSLDLANESDGQRQYQDQFCALFNYATLPFYWARYEPEPGQTDEARLMGMARWCAERGIRTKGHPLVWHEVYPAWADRQTNSARELLEQRVREIVTSFAGLVDMWDVINESTVSHNHENGVGQWSREVGMVEIAAECMRWVRAPVPAATLVLNDFNVCPRYEQQIEEVLGTNGRFDVIGTQSHMHAGEWPFERLWEVCETYGRFGLPLHFTEMSVISGAYVPRGVKFNTYRPAEWPTTAAHEERQREYVEAAYTLLFSHPAVEAVTWWNFQDGQWMNAPSGLLRRDMSPKPAYERLLDLVTRVWRTHETVTTDPEGRACVKAFHGDYEVTDTETGRSMVCVHSADRPAEATLSLA